MERCISIRKLKYPPAATHRIIQKFFFVILKLLIRIVFFLKIYSIGRHPYAFIPLWIYSIILFVYILWSNKTRSITFMPWTNSNSFIYKWILGGWNKNFFLCSKSLWLPSYISQSKRTRKIPRIYGPIETWREFRSRFNSNNQIIISG